MESDADLEHKRKLWADLHTWAAKFPDEPSTEEKADGDAWLAAWLASFPDGCPCRAEWEKIVTIEAPPLSAGGLTLFWWTVAVHDRVNVILGKPVAYERSKGSPLLRSLQDPALIPSDLLSVYRQRLQAPALNLD